MKLKVSRIRVGFQIVLHLVLIGHVLAYYFLHFKQVGSLDFQSFFHDLLSNALLTAGAILALLAFVMTFLLGRIFCSWGCHFGAFQDLAAWILRKLGWKAPYLRTRFLHWVPYALLLAIFLVPAVENWLSVGDPRELRVDLAANPPWATLPGWVGSVVTFAACGIGILLFLGTRGFCRFICPYGATFRILDPLSPMRVRRVAPCSGTCGTVPDDGPGDGSKSLDSHSTPCTLACPTAVAVHEETKVFGYVKDRDCIRCHLCIEACPQQALGYTFRPLPVLPSKAEPNPPKFTLSLGREIIVAVVTLVAFFAWDLTLAAHFLAAALALGEGFLALLVLETISRRDLRVGPLIVRQKGQWTFAAASVLGIFLLTLMPLAQGASFKFLKSVGDRALDQVFPTGQRRDVEIEEVRLWLAKEGALQVDLSKDATPTSHRSILQRAELAYESALELFPGNRPTLRKYILVLTALGDRQALKLARDLAREDADPRSATLLTLVEAELGTK